MCSVVLHFGRVLFHQTGLTSPADWRYDAPQFSVPERYVSGRELPVATGGAANRRTEPSHVEENCCGFHYPSAMLIDTLRQLGSCLSQSRGNVRLLVKSYRRLKRQLELH